jgi:hypothetical protein
LFLLQFIDYQNMRGGKVCGQQWFYMHGRQAAGCRAEALTAPPCPRFTGMHPLPSHACYALLQVVLASIAQPKSEYFEERQGEVAVR